MKIALLILVTMIFCHIIADYNLQGWLASAKQKSWWKENASDHMYRNDYKAALFMHSFQWAFMIQLPAALYGLYAKELHWIQFIWFILNIWDHYLIDDLKANRKSINLVKDQIYHMLQIGVAWVGCILPIVLFK